MNKFIKSVVALFAAVAVIFSPIDGFTGIATRASAAGTITKTGAEIANFFASDENKIYDGYGGMCLSYVQMMFQKMGAAQSTDCCALKYGESHIVSTSRDDIPLGADIFFSGSKSYHSGNYGYNHDCGHVGVYIGNGYFISMEKISGTSQGKVKKRTIYEWEHLKNYNYKYMGWGVHGNVTISDIKKSNDFGDMFYSYIYRPDSGQYLTYHDDGNVTADAFTGAENQKWWFEYDIHDHSVYAIMTAQGKYLRIDGTTARSNVSVGDWNMSYYVMGSSGSYTLVLRDVAGMAIDIAAGSTEPGANVQIFDKNDSAAQTFEIQAISSRNNGSQAESLQNYIPSRNLYYNSSSIMTGNDVRWLQKCLNILGVSCSIDGSYGPGTATAVKSFQSTYGLEADGKAGPATREKIVALLQPYSNVLSVSENPAMQGATITVTAEPVGGRYINNYNFHVITPYGVERFYQLGTEKSLRYRVTHTGTYKIYCEMNNDCGTYYDPNNCLTIIVPENISSASVGEIPAQTYTGYEITPEVTVTYNGKVLTRDTDYSVIYSGNVNVGTAGVTVSGIGNYTGTAYGTFSIVPCDVSALQLSEIPAQTYTGYEITPEVTVAYNGRALTRDTDYSVIYSGNVNVGTAGVTVSGIGNYTGTAYGTFSIVPCDVSALQLSEIPAQTYTGYDITPEVTVAYNGRVLTKNTDYTLSYKSNRNVGRATVIITGMSNFTGSRELNFTIEAPAVTKPYIVGYKAGDCKVKLEWKALDGAEMYRVYYYLNGKYTRAFTAEGSRTIATVSGLTGGTRYGFVVSAKVNGAWTAYNDPVDLVYVTPTGTPKPTIVGYKVGENKVKLQWNEVPGAEMYRVYYHLGGKYTRVFTTDGSRTIATVSGLSGGTEYGFVVSAKVNGAWTAYNDAADLVYATPTGTAKPFIIGCKPGDGKVKLEWQAVPKAEMYRVYYYLNGKYTRAFTTDGSRTIATVSGLTNGTNYAFIVSAKVNGAWTDYTNPSEFVLATPNA